MPAKINETLYQRYKDIIISSLISIIITIIFGYYFLYAGIRERRPTFYVDPIRTTILDKANAANAPLMLLKANGDTISSDVTSVFFYFFNQGEETIKHENIYSPLRIVLGDDAEILDYKVLKVARSVSGVEIVRDTTENFLTVNLRALEENDGVVGQLIFEGKKDASIRMEGGIDGAKHFETRLSNIDPVYFFGAVVIFLIASYILLIVSRRNPKSSPRLLFFFSAIPILYLILMLYKTEWFVGDVVPETLHLEQFTSDQSDWQLPAWFN